MAVAARARRVGLVSRMWVLLLLLLLVLLLRRQYHRRGEPGAGCCWWTETVMRASGSMASRWTRCTIRSIGEITSELVSRQRVAVPTQSITITKSVW